MDKLHSSRMRTAHVLTVSPSMLMPEGVPGPRGVYLVLEGVPGSRGVYLVLGGVPGPGGVPGWGVYLVLGGTLSLGGVPGPRGVPGQVLPTVNRMTDACKNITLPQLCCGW